MKKELIKYLLSLEGRAVDVIYPSEKKGKNTDTETPYEEALFVRDYCHTELSKLYKEA